MRRCWPGPPTPGAYYSPTTCRRLRASHRPCARAPADAGRLEISRTVPIGVVINDLMLLVEASEAGEWEGQVRYLPLR